MNKFLFLGMIRNIKLCNSRLPWSEGLDIKLSGIMSQHKKWLHLRWFMSIDLKPFRTLGVWIRTTLCTHWNIWQISLPFPLYLSNPFPFPKFFFKCTFPEYHFLIFFISFKSVDEVVTKSLKYCLLISQETLIDGRGKKASMVAKSWSLEFGLCYAAVH